MRDDVAQMLDPATQFDKSVVVVDRADSLKNCLKPIWLIRRLLWEQLTQCRQAGVSGFDPHRRSLRLSNPVFDCLCLTRGQAL
jgi:hypothetical protein